MNGRVRAAIIRHQADTFLKRGQPEKARCLYQEILASSEKLSSETRGAIDRRLQQIKLETRVTSKPSAPEPVRLPPQSKPIQSPYMKHFLELIVNGSARIETTEAFKYLIKEYPEEPDLLRVYANRLNCDNLKIKAADTYGQAAAMYFQTGRIFQGWVCKILEWRLQKASREQLSAVQKAIRGAIPQHPVDEFVKNLSWAERTAVFSKLQLVSVSPGAVIPTAKEDDLYFLISGNLKEDGGANRLRSRSLMAPDFFGHSDSPEMRKAPRPDIHSVTSAELAKISKDHLESTFRRFPDVEKKFQELYRQAENRQSKALKRVRKGERHFFRTFMNLCILPLRANEPALVLKGFSHELSLTGVSFVPDPKGTPCTLDTSSLIGRRVLTRIIAEGISVEVQGEIVRTNQVIAYGNKLLAFGIQFAELSPQLRWMVFTFATHASVSLPKSEHEYLFSCPLEHNWRI